MNNWKQQFERARLFAIKAHSEQYYCEKPYEYHLQAVINVLIRFGTRIDCETNAPLLVAAWLHDTLEDTSLDKEGIAREFGVEVAELVWLVTDAQGRNRKERKAATYLKTKQSEKAIILKLADRIANVEESLQNSAGLFQMYMKEQEFFQIIFALKRRASKPRKCGTIWTTYFCHSGGLRTGGNIYDEARRSGASELEAQRAALLTGEFIGITNKLWLWQITGNIK